MKKIVLLLLIFVVTKLLACDIGVYVFKGRAVMQDKRVLTGYFLLDGHAGVGRYGNSMLCEPNSYSVKNNTNILPGLADEERSSWFYVPDYVKLPWGYYYNSDTMVEVNFSKADSVIYLSEHEPMEIKRLAPWHDITTMDINLLKDGICATDYSQMPISTEMYVSTRDTLSNDELELYTLATNLDGADVKDSYHKSFFYTTEENKRLLDYMHKEFHKASNSMSHQILQEFGYNRAKLLLLPDLIDRNVLMPQDFKTKLKGQIKTAVKNMDVVINYYTLLESKSPLAVTAYSDVIKLAPPTKDPKATQQTKLWSALETTLFPQLDSYFDSGLEYGQDKVKLREVGIVQLECWLNSDGF